MACLFFYILRSCTIFYSTVFLVITGNPSFAGTTNIYYLNSSIRSITWYNNQPTIMDGWKMKILLSVENNNLGFYFGFYSSRRSSINDYLLSVVALRLGNMNHAHTVVWSANGGSLVPENSSLQFSISGLELRKPDGSTVWSTPKVLRGEFFGPFSRPYISLKEEGNLLISGFDTGQQWDTFHVPGDTLLVGQGLDGAQMLDNGKSYAGLTEPAKFSVFMSTSDGRRLIYYQLLLSDTPSIGLVYQDGDYPGSVQYFATSKQFQESNALKFIEFVKLDSDGRLRTYHYDSKEENGTNNIVDMISRQCQTTQERYHLTQVTETMYFDVESKDAAVKSITTLRGCKRVCLQNCSCIALLFSYEIHVSDGNCYISSGIISVEANRINQSKSLTFIKVLSVTRLSSSPPHVLPSTPSPSPSPLQAPGGTTPKTLLPALPPKHRKKAAVIAFIAGGIILTILIISITLVMWRRNRVEKDTEDDQQIPGLLLQFSFEELEIATENFQETLGRGGFGSVFKGVLADGAMIAVKRLDKLSQDMREFLAEVKTIGSIHHFNLVRLVGFCAEKSCRLLVYEYMSNGSLDKWIFNRDQAHCLDWQTRKKIILDIAKGLAYLHEDCRQKIIHLDVKPQNILLNEYFNAKLSDFGLSKLIERDESQVFTPMRGTPGYLAPELQQSIVTVKVDVYSYGIVILEIVSKRRNVDSSRSESSFHLLKMLQKKAEEDRLIDIVEDLDEEMQNNREEVMRMIRIGAWCLQNDHTKRPSMSTVVKVLEGVMEVDTNISYKFAHALAGSSSVANGHITVAPQASVLSAPR